MRGGYWERIEERVSGLNRMGVHPIVERTRELEFDIRVARWGLRRRLRLNLRVFRVRKWGEWLQAVQDTACRYNEQQESVLRKRGRSEHWKDLGQKGRMALTVSVKMSLSHRVHISPFSRPSMNTSIFCHNSDFPTKQLNRSLTWSVPKLVLLVFSTSDWQQGLSRLYFSPHPLLPPQTFPRVISAQLFPFRAQPNLFRGYHGRILTTCRLFDS